MAFSNAYAQDGQTDPARLQRVANSAIAPDASGIIGARDLLVRALGAQGVSVDPGAAVIANTYPLAGFRQSYIVTNDAADDDAIIEVPAAGSASPRTDYLIYRVYDEEYAGQTDTTGKGGGLLLVASLPTSYPHVALAKIVQPAGNTAGIQQSMVTDLRVMANPRTKRYVRGIPAVSDDTGMTLTADSEPGEYFPNGEGNNLGPIDVPIPEWATMMTVKPTWTGVKYDGSKSPYGVYWVEWGDKTGTSTREKTIQRFKFDSAGGNNARVIWTMADTVSIPKKYRGQTVRFVPKAMLEGGSGVSVDARSGMEWDIYFEEVADSDVT